MESSISMGFGTPDSGNAASPPVPVTAPVPDPPEACVALEPPLPILPEAPPLLFSEPPASGAPPASAPAACPASVENDPPQSISRPHVATAIRISGDALMAGGR